MWRMKRKCAAISTVLVGVLILAGIFTAKMEENKQKPYERNVGIADKNKTQLYDSNKDIKSPDWRELAGDNVINVDGLKVEMLSCEIVDEDDIKTQNRYPEQYFNYAGLGQMDLSADETDKQVKTRYYFIKCLISNESVSTIETPLKLYTVYLSKERDKIWYSDNCCYCDKPEYTTDSGVQNSLFDCRLEAGETQECTLGFEVSATWGDGEIYYFGIPPVTDETYNPDIVPDLIRTDLILNQ